MRIAVLGDIHGNFELASQLLIDWQEAHGQQIDVCLQVGDLMPNRDAADMEHSAAGEARYRYPGDFVPFHEGERTFPCPMLFIAGNHDPYNWLDQMPQGGWLNQWLYYLGRATSTDHEGLNICGISGIFHPKKSLAQHRGTMPETHTAADRKAYTYFTTGEVETLLEAAKTDVPCDILLLHDWPSGLDRRPFVGNEWARRAILELKPPLVFCGHMHRGLEARVGESRVVCLNALKSPEKEPGTGEALFVFEGSPPGPP